MTQETLKRVFADLQRITETNVFRWLYRLILLLIVAIILYVGWKYRDILIPYFKSANPVFLLFTVLFYGISLSSGVLGWVLIISNFTDALSWFIHIKIYFLTLVSRRLPGTIWYIGGRAVLYKELGISAITTSVSSMIELITTIISGCIVGIIALVFGTQLRIFILTIILLFGLGSILHPKILTHILKLLTQYPNKEILWYMPLSWLAAFSMLWLSSGVMVIVQIKKLLASSRPKEILK